MSDPVRRAVDWYAIAERSPHDGYVVLSEEEKRDWAVFCLVNGVPQDPPLLVGRRILTDS